MSCEGIGGSYQMLNFDDYNINESVKVPPKYKDMLYDFAKLGFSKMTEDDYGVNDERFIESLKILHKYGLGANRRVLETVNFNHPDPLLQLESACINYKVSEYFHVREPRSRRWVSNNSFEDIMDEMKLTDYLNQWIIDNYNMKGDNKLKLYAFKKAFHSTIKLVPLNNSKNFPKQMFYLYKSYIDVKLKKESDQVTDLYNQVVYEMENGSKEYQPVKIMVRDYLEEKFPDFFGRIKRARVNKDIMDL